jgi:transposase
VFNYRGIEYSQKDYKFGNDAKGFETFKGWMQGYVRMNGAKKVIVGFEPTGHYWYNFADFLKTLGIMFVMVAPQHVKHSKEMDDNTQRKDDHKDPRVIAKLVTEGRYIIPYVPEGIYAELRTAYGRYCELTETKVRLENRITRWFDIYFPEYREVYGTITAMSGLMVLRKAPLPKDIVSLGAEGVNRIWRDAKLRAIGMKRAKTLVAVAERSIGSRHADAAVRMDLWQLLDEWELCEKQLAMVTELLAGLVAQAPNADKLLAIPGIGLVTVAGFLAEVGDISRFDDPKEIQKLAGLAIVENSSGKHKGMSQISRRGRSRLRKVLFQAAMSAVKSNA